MSEDKVKWTTVYVRPSKLRQAIGITLVVLLSICVGVMMWAGLT